MRYVLITIFALLAFALLLGSLPSSHQSDAPAVAAKADPPQVATIASQSPAEPTPPAPSPERDVDSPECKAVISRISAKTGAKLKETSAGVLLSHSGTGTEIVLYCAKPWVQSVSFSLEDAAPTQSWFDLIGKAGGVVTGSGSGRINKAARKCVKSALRDETESYELKLKGFEVNCQTSTTDGGGTSVMITKNDDEPETAQDSDEPEEPAMKRNNPVTIIAIPSTRSSRARNASSRSSLPIRAVVSAGLRNVHRISRSRRR